MLVVQQAGLPSQFEFHQGPIFSHFILADEVNRATPKTQSALLEAMEEFQVTVDGETRDLPQPFFVIATQNPMHQIGTYPLPESQLDRFLMRLNLGFPGKEAERDLLQGEDRREMIGHINPVLDGAMLISIQKQAAEILGIDQPKVSRLVRGLLDEFSTERLLMFLNAFGYDVEIKIKRTPKSRKKGQIRVAA